MNAPRTCGFEMLERFAPSRPLRLGTRRRRAAGERFDGGGGRAAAKRPASLDTEKVLQATSVSDHVEKTLWHCLQEAKTEQDRYQERVALHRKLTRTARMVWEQWRAKGVDDDSRAWWASYDAARIPLEGEAGPDRYKRVQAWLKVNKPQGSCAMALKWERRWMGLEQCQKQWIGYKAACCGERTGCVAVPIGCNHRLCPLCAWHRSQRARITVKKMYDRLTHPVLITLTIPNQKTIRKHTFNRLKQCVKVWLSQRKDWIAGGIYAVETTYNRHEGATGGNPWHVHVHILADFKSPLPNSRQEQDFYGARMIPFTALKWWWEFDWLQLTCAGQWGKRPKPTPPKRDRKKKKAWKLAQSDYEFDLGRWVRAKQEHSTKWAKYFDVGARKWKVRTDLNPTEKAHYKRLERWNAGNTRVTDMRPVLDRDGAVKEVLKYITKCSDFCDLPAAVEGFCDAAQSVRMYQTFGSWYGLNIDTDFDANHLDDWPAMPTCDCGLNAWERMGVYYRRDCRMDSKGRWWLKRSITRNNVGGTVPRPTIRALDPPGESEDTEWQMR